MDTTGLQIASIVVLVLLIVALIVFVLAFHRLTNKLTIAANRVLFHEINMQKAVQRLEDGAKEVAANLAASVGRADATEGPEGAAADAALRTGDSAEKIHKRQSTGRHKLPGKI